MEQNRLMALKCQNCDKIYIPPKYVCPECGSGKLQEVALSGEGAIYSYTTIRTPPVAFQDQAPYDVIIVALKENLNITGRLVTEGGKTPQIGAPVSFVKRDQYGPWFRLK